MHIPLSEAMKAVPTADSPRWKTLFQHGTLAVEIYAPRGSDAQTPHQQDEVYVIAQGSGEFVAGERRMSFKAGDLLFVPAHTPHRFENFSTDFFTWVIFYGTQGGENGR